MEQLDAVYNVFSNLEKNYARSKKSRHEYIEEKFGGDISIGSFLILNALSAEELTNPEDISKFSKVREIFGKLLENKDRLDSLSSFDFDDDSISARVYAALDAGQQFGCGYKVVEQRELYSKAGAFHYKVKANATTLTPLATAKYINVYSHGMAKLLHLSRGVLADLDAVYENKLGGACELATHVKF